MTPKQRKRFAELAPLVRPEDKPKLRAIDRHMEEVREKHHPGSIDPDTELDFMDMPPEDDDEP